MFIDHINIKSNLELMEEVKDFYCFIFDMHASSRPNFSMGGYWLYSGENALVHLMESDQHHPSNDQGCFDHVSFKVTDLSQILAKLEELGVEVKQADVPGRNLQQLFFKDPAGVTVEVLGETTK